MKGIVIGGENMNNMRYADDTALITECTLDLQELVTAVNEKGKPYGMEMNVIKTKTMVVSRQDPVPKINITIEGKPIEQVKNMVYLGHMATEDARSEKEIRRRIEIARSAFENMSKTLTSRSINIELRLRLAKCYVWSTLLYGSETWTMTKSLTKKIEAFEMWIFRRMLKISYTEHKSNDAVLKLMKTEKQLINTIKQRKCRYFGHLIRRDGLQRLLLEGRINGKRGRGRPRTMWMDNIKEWTKLNYNENIRMAQDREKWRSMVANLLKADGT